jgi:predicted DNA-binding transcriptional regulator AlpA
MATAIASTTWVGTPELCRLLGLSRSTLHKLKAAGRFTPGVCWYRRGIGRTAPTAWNVEECRAVLQRLTAADPAALETYVLPRAGAE